MPKIRGSGLKCEKLPADVRDELISLADQGYSAAYLEKYLEDKGYKISRKSIQIWLDRLEENIQKSEPKQSDQFNDKMARDTSANPILDTPQDIESILASVGYSKIDLDSPENVIGLAQKLAGKMYLQCQLITINRLNKYQDGESKFPSEQIKAIRYLTDSFSKLYGIENMVSVDSAIRSLKAYGIDIEPILKEIENVSDTTN